ncbi:phosphoadenylyl-sulfate reductase [Neisseria leonii]|uniref:phosphoadenylyl-sulfate reductase n=1 Tax=Neisseria leonii TaxID=2995413 RepID=UPI00237B9F0D|nr:phosphoadenylyl-sulfate reductase [Neisseria sp. 3986]MDD9325474.1 phosphoadenylyl-sulfate reductase [Neisseria sp. 3986]
MKPELWQIPEVAAAAAARLGQKTAELDRRLCEIAERFPDAVLASSLAVEDMLITDRIAALSLPLGVFTLDTGRLNPETAALIGDTRRRYPHIGLTVWRPQDEAAQAFDREHGASGIYESVAVRKACCTVRKVEPLNRALSSARAWLTGQRRGQSPTRSGLDWEECDRERGIVKFNPIFDWEEDDVWAYAAAHNLPLNALYRQGYPSIGCEPCTRPVKKGEDIRAGRWWWESRDSKECGLHSQNTANPSS